MTWNITDRFPDWGETGESPPNGFFYEGGDQVNEKHLDYLWNSIKGLEEDVQSALNDIDSDGDGKVDNADQLDGNNAASFADNPHGNGQHSETYLDESTYDSDGNGKVDAAESADSATDATNVTSTYKGNDIDSDGDGKVDAADSADTASGITGVRLQDLEDVELAVFGTTTVSAGSTVTVENSYSKNNSSATLLTMATPAETSGPDARSLVGATNPDRDSFVEGDIGIYTSETGNSTYELAVVNLSSSSREVEYQIYEVQRL